MQLSRPRRASTGPGPESWQRPRRHLILCYAELLAVHTLDHLHLSLTAFPSTSCSLCNCLTPIAPARLYICPPWPV